MIAGGLLSSVNVPDAIAMLQLRIDHRTEVACGRILRACGVAADPGNAPRRGRIVAKVRDVLGGEYAESRILEDHPGTCALFYRGHSGKRCAVFPTYREAALAARMAIDPTIGGFSDVVIDAGIAASPDAEFFASAVDWLD